MHCPRAHRHILFVTDALTPPARGNGTTVARWIEGLAQRGHRISVVTPERAVTPEDAADLVLAYHAERAGPTGALLAAQMRRPLLVALGGTDIQNIEGGRSPSGIAALSEARVVVGAFDDIWDRLADRLSTRPNYRTVRRGVFVDEDVSLDRARDRLRIVLPSGIRPVKDPNLALDMLERLRRNGVDATLEILGADLDGDLARRVRSRASAMGGVAIGSRPPVAMGAAYARAHVVWNTSLHEGGANAVLEAISLGCSGWLRDVPGNRQLAREADSPIALFATIEDPALVAFHRESLLADPVQRAARFRRAVTWLRRCHDPADEIADLELAIDLALAK